MILTDVEIAWIAGLLEGEGCFATSKNCPEIMLAMSDEDVIRKFRDLTVPTNTISVIQGNRIGRDSKPMYRVGVYAKSAVELMETILPYMGIRRAIKISEILSEYTRYHEHKGNFCKHGHDLTDSNSYTIRGSGQKVCKICQQEWNAKRKGA